MPAKGDGITKRKDGRYMARYTIETPEGPKRKTIYGRKYKEVERKLAEARGDAARGLVFDADNLKLGEYLDRWLVDSVADTVRPTTFERYEQIVRVHIRPALGKLKLKNVTPAHVRGLYREKLEVGLSPRTVQYIHVTLHKALKQAVADGLIPRNATEGRCCDGGRPYLKRGGLKLVSKAPGAITRRFSSGVRFTLICRAFSQ
jgi:integrase